MKRRDFLQLAVAAPCVALGTNVRNAFSLENETSSEDGETLRRNVVMRGNMDLQSAIEAFGRGKGDVAFLGGSITEMDGYRPMVCEYLQKTFPKTEFNFVAAGISSTCSDVGAFRLETDVLKKCKKGAPDLFFVEFSVNDDQDGRFSLEHATRGMEGVVRHIKRANPSAAVIMTFFVNENLMTKYREGSVATSIQAHDAVARRYDCSTINMAREIQTQIDSGDITWSEFGGVHPAPRGNRICADMIAAVLDRALDNYKSEIICGVSDMPEPLDPYSYSDAGWRGFDGVTTNVGAIGDATPVSEGGFRLFTPDWSKIPGSFRGTFAGVPCLCAEKPGAEASFDFDGNAVALYILAGPDAGIVECQIDGGDVKKIDAYHDYSSGLHYPRAITLADALEFGKHKATIRVSSDKNARSRGTALRIMQIGVNRAE